MPTVTISKNVPMGIPREGSFLRSPRDADDMRQLRKRIAPNIDQSGDLRVQVEALTRKVETMRRRILGGAGGQSGVSTAWCGEWDPTRAYTPGNMVVISTGSNAGTFACNVSNTGQAPYAGGGFWTQLPLGNLGQWL